MPTFLTGISLSTWLKIGAGAVFALLIWSWHSRGETIEDLRGDVAAERLAHEISLSSLAKVSRELDDQNLAIEAQRAAREQAQRDLAVAVEASAPGAALVDRLIASARAVPAGQVCLPSKTVQEIWK